MKVEVDVLGSPSVTVLNVVSVDIKQHLKKKKKRKKKKKKLWVQSSELRSCVKVEVDVLGSPSKATMNEFELSLRLQTYSH